MVYKGAFQTTFLGTAIRYVSRNRLLMYPDEIDFPERYTKESIARREDEKGRSATHDVINVKDEGSSAAGAGAGTVDEKPGRKPPPSSIGVNDKHGEILLVTGERPRNATVLGPPLGEGAGDNSSLITLTVPSSSSPSGRTTRSQSPVPTGADVRADFSRQDNSSEDDAATVVEDPTPTGIEGRKRLGGPGSDHGAANVEEAEQGQDPNLVTWYGADDPENPYNWSTKYKAFVAFQMAFLTFAVYIGSSIYSSGVEGIMAQFTVSETTALVGLTAFVAGYGVGPCLWAPLSEFPSIGRLPIYLGTLFVFVAIQFPTIYANNIHTLLAMRFFAGFVGSPALAVGGATMGDSTFITAGSTLLICAFLQMFTPKYLAYAIGVWGCGAICGPVLGPLLGGFTYQAKGWTWPLWVLVWLSGGCLVLVAIFFPETSTKNILYRRMRRLQKATGNMDLTTQAKLDTSHMTSAALAKDILWRPFVLMWDPILLVYNTYLALIYGLLYVWFESFPLVFQEVHGFTPGASGLAFMGIFVGAWLSCACFCVYIHKYLGPIFDQNGGTIPNPEIRLYPSPIAAFCIPISMFFFGWSGMYASVHWIVPVVASGFFGVGAFILFQCVFAYFGDVYYAEIAAVLTLNDLFRSSFGAAFPLFANALFSRLGIGGGNSLLGGLACLFVPFPFLFIKYGKTIRKRSKYALQDKN